MFASTGNVVVIAKFASHCAAAATARAAARILFGNISPSSTHTTGPQVAAEEHHVDVRRDQRDRPPGVGQRDVVARAHRLA